jgi:hypothetical protein
MTERKQASALLSLALLVRHKTQTKLVNPTKTQYRKKKEKFKKSTTQPQNLGSAFAIATKTLQRRLRTPASLPQGFPSPPRTSFARAQTARPRSFVREPR